MLGHQADEREYSAAAAIIEDLGILSIRLMTNNPAKIDHLEQLGVSILERLPLQHRHPRQRRLPYYQNPAHAPPIGDACVHQRPSP